MPHLHRRFSRAILAGVVCLSLVPAASAAGEHAKSVIVLRGTGGSHYADLVVKHRMKVSMPPFYVPGRDEIPFEGSTTGGYVGYTIEALPARKIVVGGIWAKDLDSPDWPLFMTLARGGILRPGRYRFTLIAPSETHLGRPNSSSVLIPAEGLGSDLVVNVKRKAKVQGTVFHTYLPPGAPAAIPVMHDLSIRAKTTTVLAGSIEADFGQATYGSTCLNPKPQSAVCEVEDEDSGFSAVSVGSTYSGMLGGRVYKAGEMPAGNYRAEIKMMAAGHVRHAAALVLTIN